jgi:triphosphatase
MASARVRAGMATTEIALNRMGLEAELKLEISPSDLGRIARLPWLSEISNGPPKREKLVTVYFDTPRSKLRAHGLALRVRHAGRRRLQTIKALKKGARGAFGRDEWEAKIAGDIPDLKLAKGTSLGPLITEKLRRKLKPVFETVVDRTVFPLHSDEAELELALDRGHIKANRSRERISEIEIELKRGDRSEIAMIAERLAQTVPVAYAALSKPERGYALGSDQAGKPVCGSVIELDPGMLTGAAFQTIALSCLDHATSNQRAVREGETEGIHQMRVGLRRLRAAMSIFKELLQDQETEAIKPELKWLAEQLGPARDFDVLVEERVRPLHRAPLIAAGTGELMHDLEAKRAAGIERAQAAVNSNRYRAMGLNTALWLANGGWSRSIEPLTVARRERPAVEFAAEILAKRSRKILKKVKRIEALDGDRRHKLRIGVKKLRYAGEFFTGLYPRRKEAIRRKHFTKTLKVLQRSLGILNDIEVHKGAAVTIARPRKTSKNQAEKALAMGFIAGQEQQQVLSCIAAVKEAGRQLGDSRKFWK